MTPWHMAQSGMTPAPGAWSPVGGATPSHFKDLFSPVPSPANFGLGMSPYGGTSPSWTPGHGTSPSYGMTSPMYGSTTPLYPAVSPNPYSPS